jgi:RNA-directed DNA polymerase
MDTYLRGHPKAANEGHLKTGQRETTGLSSGNRVTMRANRTKCGYYSPVARPFKGTSRLRAPLIPTIPSMKPTSKNAKETIWRERFGGRGLFAFSGDSNAGPVPCATPRSIRITGWRIHYCVPRVSGGSTRADNRVLLHPECHDRVHRQRLSVSKTASP